MAEEGTCHACGHVGFADGFFCCLRCGSQEEDIIDTAVWVKTEPLSQSQPKSVLRLPQSVDDNVSVRVKQEDGVGPTGPGDFGSAPTSLSYDDYYSEIRMRDMMGIHIMIRMQCKAWVEEFRVSPLIFGLAGSIWLRLVALSGVFGDSWADESIYESESQKQGQPDDFKPRAKYSAEPHNIHSQRAVMICYWSLSKKIPLSHSLVISLLVRQRKARK